MHRIVSSPASERVTMSRLVLAVEVVCEIGPPDVEGRQDLGTSSD